MMASNRCLRWNSTIVGCRIRSSAYCLAAKAKTARLKQAKDEAEKEIAEFGAHVELEFQKKLAASSGDSGANVKRLEQETDAKIHHLKIEAGSILNDVFQMLLKYVTTVGN